MRSLIAALLVTFALTGYAASSVTVNYDEYFAAVVENVISGKQSIVIVTAPDRDTLKGDGEQKFNYFLDYLDQVNGEGWVVVNHKSLAVWLDIQAAAE